MEKTNTGNDLETPGYPAEPSHPPKALDAKVLKLQHSRAIIRASMYLMDRRPARKQALPPKEAAHLNTLSQDDLMARAYELYTAGWTLQSIGDALIPPRPRSTIHSWLLRFQAPDISPQKPGTIPIPRYQTHQDGYQKRRPESPGIQPDELELIQELAPVARRFRAKVSSSDSTRVANDQLTAICIRLYYTGVTTTELAKAAGVTYRAMVKRLGKL